MGILSIRNRLFSQSILSIRTFSACFFFFLGGGCLRYTLSKYRSIKKNILDFSRAYYLGNCKNWPKIEFTVGK